MKQKNRKKKSALPRRTWKIHPATRVKASGRLYSRARARRRLLNEEE